MKITTGHADVLMAMMNALLCLIAMATGLELNKMTLFL